MKKGMKFMKKNKIVKLITIISILLFIIGIISFIVDACTIQNVALAWVLFSLILFSIISFTASIVLFAVFNRERIRNYLNRIINK